MTPTHPPRLRLKPKAQQHNGYVDGAWWPHTDDLAAELPDLLAVLSVRLGRIERVSYRLSAWPRAPRKLVTGGRVIKLDGYRLQRRNTIEVVGLNRDRVDLLVVPPYTEPSDAHTTMMTAAQPNNAATIDGLLVISPRDRERRTLVASAQDHWNAGR
ncbi:DUF5994 family protein [Mycolicibacterium sp. XJ870]